MSKVERLNTRVAKLLTVAVHEVLEVVRETVSEYQEKTARTQRENERLRRRLRDALARLDREREATRQASISLAVDRVAQRCEPAWGSDTGQDPEPGEARQRGVNAELRRAQRGQQREEAEQRVEEAGQSQSAADLETVCDLSVALTLAEQKWTAAEDGGSRVINEQAPEDGGGYQALSLRVPSSMKSDDGLDSICAAGNATRPDPQSPSTDAPPRAAVEGVKTEQDVAEYPAAPREPSGGFGFAEDLSASSAASAARHEPPAPAAPKSPLVADSDTGSYGLVFSHAALGRRLGYGRGVRAALDARRHKQAPRREEQHVCAVCGKTFSRVGNLRIHQRCHTGEKPYHCPQCGRCFSQAGDLKKHKRVHTGEKPYYCGQCGKSFSRGENLKRHQKIHIGESLHPQQAWTEPPAS